MTRAVVIGSGLSGLTAGAKLAQEGYEVIVFEQFERPGGVTAPLEKSGFKWDLGQLLIEGLGPNEPCGEVLADLELEGAIQFIRDDRGYVFPDFAITKPGEYGGVQWRINKLKDLFPEDASGLDKYWKDYLRFTRLMTLGRALAKAGGWKKATLNLKLYWTLLPLIPKIKWSAQLLMDHYFKSKRLKCVFISILADFFTKPSQFIGLGVYALNYETFYEKRIPKTLAKDTDQLYLYSVLGGISSLVDALVGKIQSHDGVVHASRPVTEIKVDGNQVAGVVDCEGQFIPSDVVVASGGAKETFNKLVGKAHLTDEFSRQVDDIALMDSVFMVHLGVDFDPSPYVHGVCTYFYGTYDIEGGIDEAKAGIYHEGEKGLVVHIPTLHTPELAPEGHHAVTVYTICPDRLKEGSWEEHKEDYADKLIAYAEYHIPRLNDHVKERMVLTPEDFRHRTHLDHHAFGGIAPIMGKSGIPHKTPIQGLWFVGAQSESGGGINNVVPAAFQTAQAIIEEQA
jgi:all-trans-retinol 13,14-reductase